MAPKIPRSHGLLEINPREGGSSILDSTLVLVPTGTDPSTKKRGCKESTVRSSSFGGVEMILALLAKMVALHVGRTKVDV